MKYSCEYEIKSCKLNINNLKTTFWVRRLDRAGEDIFLYSSYPLYSRRNGCICANPFQNARRNLCAMYAQCLSHMKVVIFIATKLATTCHYDTNSCRLTRLYPHIHRVCWISYYSADFRLHSLVNEQNILFDSKLIYFIMCLVYHVVFYHVICVVSIMW